MHSVTHCFPRQALSAWILFYAFAAFSQNLVPNNSFETLSACPSTFGGSGPTLAPPWIAPTLGTPDIFNQCCVIPNSMGVPTNFFGNQNAVTGVGYAGFYARLTANEYREYVQAPLNEPLVAGEWYAVSFYVSNSEYGCGVERIGAYLSPDAFTVSNFLALPYVPQVESFGGYISDQVNWTLIEGCFQAAGGEAYITIGCFHDDTDNPTDPNCGGNTSYYYLDEVTVIPGNEPGDIPFDLGGPVEACFEYEIDPGLSGYNFIWEDGSHGETLIVEESGTYSLTVSSGCDFGIDSIEVEIGGYQPPVDIPEEFVELCAGDVFVIELDPDLEFYSWQDGSDDAVYAITTSGTYSVTLDDGCAATADEVDVLFYDPLEPLSLGDDQFLCFESTISYDFDASLGDYVWQDGSTSPSYTISEAGTYALTISNVCGEVADAIVITALDVPEIDLGPDEQLLCGDEIIDIEFDPNLGDFVWQDGSTFNYYTISEPGTYAVFVTNQCGTGSDQIVISQSPTPQFDFGPPQQLCPGETAILSVTGIDGQYEWQDGSSNTTYTVTSPGIYHLTIDNDCGTGSDTIAFGYGPSVGQPDLGADVNLCPGEQVVLHVAVPNASFEWQDGSTLDSFVVTSAGQYYVQAFNACSSLVDTVEVTYNGAPPSVDLPASVMLCQGQAVVVDAGVSGVSCLWSDNSSNASLTVTTPGTYSITVSNSCGAGLDSMTVLEGGPAPAVDLGSDVALCVGDTFDLVPAFANVDTWLWSNGASTPAIAISTSGVISVIVSNGCGTEYDTIHTSFLPAVPVFSLGNDTAVCANENVSLSVNIPNINITWSDGSTNTALTVSNTGQYFATISNACGNFADTINIGQLPAIPPLDLGNDQSLCPGELIVIDPGIPNVDYVWQDGSAGTSYSTSQAVSITLTISNACGTSTDQLEVIESTQGPDVDLGADITGCVGEDITIHSGISGVAYAWQDGSTQSSLSTTISGTYMLTVTNNCGADADTIVVDLNGLPPFVNLGIDTSLCTGETLLLQVNALPPTFIEWQDGSTLQTLEVTAAGLYYVQATTDCGQAIDSIQVDIESAPAAFSLGVDTTICAGEQLVLTVNTAPGTSISWTGGAAQPNLPVNIAGTYTATLTNDCGQATDAINVGVDYAPAPFDLGPDVVLCPGESIVLNAPVTTGQLLWQNGTTASSIVANQEQTYSLQISNQCGSAADAMELTFDILVPDIQVDPALTLCPPEPLALDVTQPFNATYSWSTGDASSSIDITAPGTYSVTVSSDCASEAYEIDVIIDEACLPRTHFYLPNIFSPNDDHVNDVFSLHTSADAVIDVIEGTIYDRWGNLVFSSKSQLFTWNGKRKDELLNPGVYVYVIKVMYLHNGVMREEVLTGDVTIVR